MKNLLYLKENDYKTKVVYTEDEKIVDIKIDKYIDSLCILSLSTKKGRVDAFKKIFRYQYNVPIYVNSETLLMKVKTKKTYWINYFMIDKIIKEKEKTVVFFKNGRIIKINAKYKTVIKNYKSIYIVYLYLQKNLI